MIKKIVHDPLVTISNEETFLPDFLVILKRMITRKSMTDFQKRTVQDLLKEMFPRYCIHNNKLKYIQSHNILLPVVMK